MSDLSRTPRIDGLIVALTPRERLLQIFSFDQPDRPFRWECIAYWQQTLNRWRREGLVGHPDKLFEMDPQISFLTFHSVFPIHTGFTRNPYLPPFETIVVEEGPGWRIVRGSDGILRREVKDGSSMPQWLKFPVENREDYEEIKERLDPDDPERFPDEWEEKAASYTERDIPISMPLCGFYGHLRNLFGTKRVPYFMYREPAFVRDILKYWTWFNEKVLTRVAEHLDLDYLLIWEDMCGRSGPLISPQLFERYIYPCYRSLCSHAHRLGIKNVCVDTDGNTYTLIPLFMKAGINGMIPFEVQAGNDIVRIREMYPRLVIMGGLDKLALTRGKADIDRELDTKVSWVLEMGGFIPSLDHAAPPDIPFENFCYYMKRIREIEARFS